MKIKLCKKGFTLIELIIVIAILLILMMIAIPSVMKYIDESKRVVAESNGNTMIRQVNARLALNADSHEEGKDLLRYLNLSSSDKRVTYQGPTDNSVTLTKLTSYHDMAKNAIRNLLGGTIVDFGYRAHFNIDVNGNYYIEKLEIFYKEPNRSTITVATPDFVLP